MALDQPNTFNPHPVLEERMPWPADYFGVHPKSLTCSLGDAVKGLAIPAARVKHGPHAQMEER
jgi:hypothetical protein